MTTRLCEENQYVNDEIRKLKEVAEYLPEPKKFPRSTLEIIDKADREVYWNKLLTYFLNPNAPHGFGSDILESFLGKIEEIIPGFEFEDISSQIEIESECRTSGRRFADIIIAEPDEWIIVFELKVGDSIEKGREQLEHYAKTERVAGRKTSKFSREYYFILCLARRSKREEGFYEKNQENQLGEIHWRTFAQVIRGFLSEGFFNQYSTQSVFQLSEFLRTLEEEMNMGESRDLDEEKKLFSAYLEVYEIIEKLQNGFETLKKERWPKHFKQKLEDEFPEELDNWEDWCVYEKWGHIFNKSNNWYLDEEGEGVNNRDDAEHRIQFSLDRSEKDLANGQFDFKITISNSKGDYRDKLMSELEGKFKKDRRSKKTLLTKTYKFEKGNPDAFFKKWVEAYIEFKKEYVEDINGAIEVVKEEIFLSAGG